MHVIPELRPAAMAMAPIAPRSSSSSSAAQMTRSGFDRQAALAPIAARPGGEKVLEFTFLQSISTAVSKKRSLSLRSDEDDAATSGDGSDARESPRKGEAAAAQQTKKQRKPTHVLRKVRGIGIE